MRRLGRKIAVAAAMILCLQSGMTAVADQITMDQGNLYLFPDSDSRYLTEQDIAGLSPQLIEYAKQEIYARQGMKFKSSELAGYFSSQSWYFGFLNMYEFPEGVLNKYETANIAYLKWLQDTGEVGPYTTDQEGFSYEPVYEFAATADLRMVEDATGSDTSSEVQNASGTQNTENQVESSANPVTNGEVIIAGTGISGNTQSEVIIAGTTSYSEYIFPDVAQRYLTRADIEPLSLQAICYAKNEIYARHGRQFLSRELQDYFNSKSWYQGTIAPESFSDRVFNDYEMQNLMLIVNREEELRSGGYQLDQPGYDISKVTGAVISQ